MNENLCQRCSLPLHQGSDPTDCRECDPLCPIWGTHGHLWNDNEYEYRAALESFRATPGCRYVHKKGGEYIVLSIAEHSETGESLVIYRRLSDQKIFARPKEMFEDGRFKSDRAVWVSASGRQARADDRRPPKDLADQPIDEWVENIYDNDDDRAMDILFDHVDDMFLEGKFIECDSILQSIDLDRLSSTMLVGVMSIMHAARDKLPSHKNILSKIESRLKILCPDRIDALMNGFRE